jgi:dCMP deaminase
MGSKFKVIINGQAVGYTDTFTVTEPDWHSPAYAETVFSDDIERTVSFEIEGGLKYIAKRYGPRPEWDDYFLSIADAVSTRGDCSRRRIGAVIVDRSRRLVSTGYNGVRAGDQGCISKPCDRVAKALGGSNALCPGYSDCRSVHAEANALLYADYAKCVKATLYISDEPCEACLKLIRAARIKRIVWPKGEIKL